MKSIHEKHLVPIGKVIAAFGVKGWVKIKLDLESLELVEQYKLYLCNEKDCKLYTIEQFYIRDELLFVRFVNISDRDMALMLKGNIVAVTRNSFPQTAEDEYYWVDLIGLKVYNHHNEYLGVVVNLIQTGENSVLVINDELTQRMIPFIHLYIQDVNLLEKIINVYWELDY